MTGILLNSSSKGILVLFGAVVCSGKSDVVFVVSVIAGDVCDVVAACDATVLEDDMFLLAVLLAASLTDELNL